MFQESPGGNPEKEIRIKTGKYRKLAKAIRQGCELAPRQCNSWFSGFDSACALGAAALAVDRTVNRGDGFELLGILEKAFPELSDPCPDNAALNLCSAIILKNDQDGWPREMIAAWLADL